MSIAALDAVFSRNDLPPFERLVMLSLADRADEDFNCYPSIVDICQRTGMAERSVQNVIKRLVDLGVLTVERGGGRYIRNRYTLVLPRENPAQETPYPVRKPRTGNTVSGAETPHQTTETPHQTTQNPAPGAPEPSRTVKEPSEEKKAHAALCAVLSPESASAFIQHRKAKRAKLTVHAAELIANKLAGHPSPESVINESIANGWTGVFPENSNTLRNQNQTVDLAAIMASIEIKGPH